MRQVRGRLRGLVIAGLVGTLTVVGSASVGAQVGTIQSTGADTRANNDSASRGTFSPGVGTGGIVSTSVSLAGGDTTANNDSASRGTFSPGVGTGGGVNTDVALTGADRFANNDSASRGTFNPGIGTGGR